MTLRWTIIMIIFLAGVFFGHYWINTQPVWITHQRPDDHQLSSAPPNNKQIIDFIEHHGSSLAPAYDEVVCTDFVIRVVSEFSPLSKSEKNTISIVLNEDLANLVASESPLIKGVQTALVSNSKGIEVINPKDVRPGDFVQFWNTYLGKNYGHCGVVLNIEPLESITLYSSHPLTDGFGKQKYLWPDKAFFVRLDSSGIAD
jgi:hypothetical protein